MNQFIDLKRDIIRAMDRERANHRRKVLAARVGLAVAAGIVLGVLVAFTSGQSAPRGVLLIAIILWGLWGFQFLSTRHH